MSRSDPFRHITRRHVPPKPKVSFFVAQILWIPPSSVCSAPNRMVFFENNYHKYFLITSYSNTFRSEFVKIKFMKLLNKNYIKRICNYRSWHKQKYFRSGGRFGHGDDEPERPILTARWYQHVQGGKGGNWPVPKDLPQVRDDRWKGIYYFRWYWDTLNIYKYLGDESYFVEQSFIRFIFSMLLKTTRVAIFYAII